MRSNVSVQVRPTIASCSLMTSTNLGPWLSRARRNNPRPRLRHESGLQNRLPGISHWMNRHPKSFALLKQIDAGVLNIGYAEAGAVDGAVVILLHGWLAVLFLNLASPCGCNGGFGNERRFS